MADDELIVEEPETETETTEEDAFDPKAAISDLRNELKNELGMKLSSQFKKPLADLAAKFDAFTDRTASGENGHDKRAERVSEDVQDFLDGLDESDIVSVGQAKKILSQVKGLGKRIEALGTVKGLPDEDAELLKSVKAERVQRAAADKHYTEWMDRYGDTLGENGYFDVDRRVRNLIQNDDEYDDSDYPGLFKQASRAAAKQSREEAAAADDKPSKSTKGTKITHGTGAASADKPGKPKVASDWDSENEVTTGMVTQDGDTGNL